MRPTRLEPFEQPGEGVQPYQMPPRPNSFYGFQREVSQVAGEAKPAQLAEAAATSLLWRVSASGVNCRFDLVWGSYGTRRLENLLSPLAITIGGHFHLSAIPIDAELAMSAVANVSVSSGGVAIARTWSSTAAVFPPTAFRVTALSTSTVNVAGVVVDVAEGASLDVVHPSFLASGGPLIVDHAL
jgi:hypothetical protein